MPSRRNFLSHTLAAIGSGLIARPAWAAVTTPNRPRATPIDIAPRAGDPLLNTLAMRALDAAKSAGATYADVRFTVTRTQSFMYASPPVDVEHVAVGVRALANGAWGFTGSLSWSPETAARLGREATAQAKGNAWPNVAPVTLDDRPAPATGSWVMPVERDPFAVSISEKLDYLRSVEAYARRFRNAGGSSIAVFERQERTFASTDGAFCTQTVYNTLGHNSQFNVSVGDLVDMRFTFRGLESWTPQSGGFERLEQTDPFGRIPVLYEEARELLSATTIDAGRYDVVFDASAMASIVDHTIGAALELDRALGFEANAGGTSYLAPPDRILGSSLGTSLLTVHANRTAPLAAATVKWDDEGVAPDDFTLVDRGVITDYATTREHVGALGTWYDAQGRPRRSHGCARAEHGMRAPVVQTPNLVMQPASQELSFDDLVSGVSDGLAIMGGTPWFDFQQLNARGRPERAYKIKNGKIAGPVRDIAYLVRAPELWRDLVAIGGAASAAWRGFTTSKGQPSQDAVHGVSAVPARFRNVRVVSADAPIIIK